MNEKWLQQVYLPCAPACGTSQDGVSKNNIYILFKAKCLNADYYFVFK